MLKCNCHHLQTMAYILVCIVHLNQLLQQLNDRLQLFNNDSYIHTMWGKTTCSPHHTISSSPTSLENWDVVQHNVLYMCWEWGVVVRGIIKSCWSFCQKMCILWLFGLSFIQWSPVGNLPTNNVVQSHTICQVHYGAWERWCYNL